MMSLTTKVVIGFVIFGIILFVIGISKRKDEWEISLALLALGIVFAGGILILANYS